jgi:hypothetical protein
LGARVSWGVRAVRAIGFAAWRGRCRELERPSAHRPGTGSFSRGLESVHPSADRLSSAHSRGKMCLSPSPGALDAHRNPKTAHQPATRGLAHFPAGLNQFTRARIDSPPHTVAGKGACPPPGALDAHRNPKTAHPPAARGLAHFPAGLNQSTRARTDAPPHTVAGKCACPPPRAHPSAE